MKIIFVVHRYHTNLYFVVKALKEAGHEVKIIVPEIELYNTLIEDHTLVKPLKINENEISVRYVYNLLTKLKPDLLILRYLEGKWILFSIISMLLGIKRVIYNLVPYYNDNKIKFFLSQHWKRFLKGKPIKRLTPVKGLGKGIREKHTTYLPFPIICISF